MHADRHVPGAVAAGHIGDLHFVAAGLWQVRNEAGGLLPFTGVAVLYVVFVNEVRGVGGFFPRASELRRRVINDDAAQLGRTHSAGQGGFHFPRGLERSLQPGDGTPSTWTYSFKVNLSDKSDGDFGDPVALALSDM